VTGLRNDNPAEASWYTFVVYEGRDGEADYTKNYWDDEPTEADIEASVPDGAIILEIESVNILTGESTIRESGQI
jgi:hypothetical protein